jgi:magnesium transporter
MFDTHTEVIISFAEHLSKVYRQRFVNNTVRAHYIQQQQLLYDEENDGCDTDTEQCNDDIDSDDVSNNDDDDKTKTGKSSTSSSMHHHPLYNHSTYHYHDDEPPEMVFLETVLADAVESSSRRIRIFEPIVEELLIHSTDEDFSNAVLHQLAPLKDQLQSFDMFVTQAYECLRRLLNDDEEMLQLLLTEQEEARRTNVPVDFERHQHVELLLGVYARQFSVVQQEASFLLSRIRSKQEFLELELDLYRNRLIRTDVELSILGVATGITTSMAGFFGMNLVSGLEGSQSAFLAVCGLSSLSAVCVGYYFYRLVSGHVIQQRAEERMLKIQTMNSALSDMNALDYTVKKIIMSGKRMNRDEFKNELKMARHSQQVSDDEVDLLFNVLNTHDDDYLDYEDFGEPDEQRINP